MDALTKNVGIAVNTLFLGHPSRTALGFVLGLALKFILQIISLGFNVSQINNIIGISDWEFGIFGVFILHLPTLRYYLFGKVNYLNENEEKAFALIKELKIPEEHKQLMYIKIVEKFLEKVELESELDQAVRKFER